MEQKPLFIEGVGLKKAFSNKAARFRITTTEQGLVASDNLSVTVEELQTGTKGLVEISDKEDNTYIIKYTCPTVGDYVLSVRHYGEEIEGAPFPIKVLPGPDASKCKASGPALQSNTTFMSGSTLEFIVDASSAGNGNLVVIVKGKKEEPKVFIGDDENQIYSCKFEPQWHGKYFINTFWGGQHIPGSPFKVKILPRPAAENVTAFGPGLQRKVVVKQNLDFTIDTTQTGIGTLKVKMHGIKGAYNIECQPKSDEEPRIVIAKYQPKETGEYTISILFEDKHIPSSPFTVQVISEEEKEDEEPPSEPKTVEELGEKEKVATEE